MTNSDITTINISLGPGLSDCPSSWQNFIRNVIQPYTKQNLVMHGETQLINQFLLEYNATYTEFPFPIQNYHGKIEFSSHDGYLLFLLRFG